MRPVVQVVSGANVSAVIPIDRSQSPATAAIGVKISATATYTVEYTYDDVFSPSFSPASATWFPHPTLTAKTANADSNLAYPAMGIRLNVAANTGTVTMTYITAGII